MLRGKFYKILISVVVFTITNTTIWGVDIYSKKGDTFIFEGNPSGEYSKSDFVAVAHVKGERAITYLPFEIRPCEIGVQPSEDIIMSCNLTLFIKSLPMIPDTNAANAKKESQTEKKERLAEEKIASEKTNKEKVEDVKELVKSSAEYTANKIEADSKNKVIIQVIGIVDEETFEPNSLKYRVSWDGKSDSIAPKHNTNDDKLEEIGIFKLGTIEINVEKDEYEDGDRIEFTSPELKEFLNFVMGITSSKNESPTFRTHLSKIENATIILRQESGPSGVFFYSADSLGEEADKIESGDEVKESQKKEKHNTIGGGVQQNEASEKADEAKAQQQESLKESSAKAKQQSNANKPKNPKDVEKVEVEKKGGQIVSENKTPDLRPRIFFEFRRDTERAATDLGKAPDDSVQQTVENENKDE